MVKHQASMQGNPRSIPACSKNIFVVKQASFRWAIISFKSKHSVSQYPLVLTNFLKSKNSKFFISFLHFRFKIFFQIWFTKSNSIKLNFSTKNGGLEQRLELVLLARNFKYTKGSIFSAKIGRYKNYKK